jgi:hypothetical protein
MCYLYVVDVCCRCEFIGTYRLCYLLGSLISGLELFEASCQEGVAEHCGF